MPDVHAIVNEFVLKLKRRKVEGSRESARQTAELLRSVVWLLRLPPKNQAAALIEALRVFGEQLIAANRVELTVGNIVRQVLHIIREEDLSSTASAVEDLGLSGGSDDDDENDSDGKIRSTDKNSRNWKLRHKIIKAINELIRDIDTCHEKISQQAVEHIHQNEVILTLGHSRTVKEFLYASNEKKRSFRVFVAEGAPRYRGHILAKELAARGLKTTVITDSAVFAMISQVNMVIVGAHAVMANGGVIAPVGVNMVALAARRHSVQFVVIAGSHKLCPLYPNNPEVFLNELKSPAELLDFGEFSECMDFGSKGGSPLLHVVNPSFDYVPPKLVSLFITDTGGHNPAYMFRLISDYYTADDFMQLRPMEND